MVEFLTKIIYCADIKIKISTNQSSDYFIILHLTNENVQAYLDYNQK